MINSIYQKKYIPILIKILGIGVFGFVLIRTAWLSDDAYITFRTVDNFVNGYGLTWNTVERVQAYTHPLWMSVMVIGRLITGENYYSSIFLSVAISLVSAYLVVFKIAQFTETAVLAIVVLILSKAFVDYSTSGLENPLTHLLVILFLWVYFQEVSSNKRLFWLSIIAALGLLNRLDTVFFFLFPLMIAMIRSKQIRSVFIVAIGFLPLAIWIIFSIIYYGFPFPNTAYAKMFGTNIPTNDLVQQGAIYLQNSLVWDPLTLTIVTLAGIAAILTRIRLAWPVTVGIFIYILYVLKIGGDFMSGRFLALPLLASTIVLIYILDTIRLTSDPTQLSKSIRFGIKGNKISINVYKAIFYFSLIGICILGLYGKHPAILYGSEYVDLAKHQENWRDGDIADERMYYYQYTGLLNRDKRMHSWQQQGRNLRENGPRVVGQGNVGFLGFYAGPDVHIVDRYGLADPLLARLPLDPNEEWRIGHFPRVIPTGYIETFVTNQNQIENQNIALYYQKLVILTQDDLFSKSRFSEIWNINTGKYDYLLEE